jgi:hypothetical protein
LYVIWLSYIMIRNTFNTLFWGFIPIGKYIEYSHVVKEVSRYGRNDQQHALILPLLYSIYSLPFPNNCTWYEVITIIILHWLGRLTCSGIDALPSFPGASTISSPSRFVIEDVFWKSDVVHSFARVDPVLFVYGSHVLYSRDLDSFLMTSLLILSSLVYALTLLRKRISAASRRVISRFVVTHVSLPQKSAGMKCLCKSLNRHCSWEFC